MRISSDSLSTKQLLVLGPHWQILLVDLTTREAVLIVEVRSRKVEAHLGFVTVSFKVAGPSECLDTPDHALTHIVAKVP